MRTPKTDKSKSLREKAEFEAVFLNATSTTPDIKGRTSIVLYWKPAPDMVGYNLYRNKTGPINGARLISQVDTCARLKVLVTEGSDAWVMLSHAFSSVASRQHIRKVGDHLGRARLDDTSGLLAERSLFVGSSIERMRPTLIAAVADPCEVIERGLSGAEQALFDQLAGANLPIRLARGWAYIDQKVSTGTTYTYELHGVDKNGKEVVLDKEVSIRAGYYRLPQPPSAFSLMAGDSQVLALWNRNNYAFSYLLQRADNPGGPFVTVNDAPIIYDIAHDLNNQELRPPRPGFVDYQRWDEEGLPVSHSVEGTAIDGPANGVTYHYRVASCDILERHGNWSTPKNTAPIDTTPPMAPTNLQVDANLSPRGLLLTWRKVTRDIRHHQILETSQTYRIYRSDLLDNLDDLDMLPAYQIATFTADPTDPTTINLSWLDTDPILQVPYGEKDFWYRLRCVDLFGNESAPSAALAGRLPDITPPGPTRVVDSDGFEDHITVFWLPNPEPDLAGYQIYRGACDYGRPYRPGGKEGQDYQPCDFLLVGEVRLTEAEKKLAETGRIFFEDFSVPGGSPLCYAYWVRAFDYAGNIYPGDRGCPFEPPEVGMLPAEYVCGRLREQTPPPVPIITALKARDKAVQIEWISSPVQDLRAFHVYRSDKEDGVPVFVGGVLTDGTITAVPWPGMDPRCGDIPGEVNPAAARGSFLDKTVEANHIYWYRVSALDWLGNESEAVDLTKIPAISTFTYDRDIPVTLAVLPPGAPPSSGCGLRVAWAPAFDSLHQKGILVFRSSSAGGNYRQVSPLVQADYFDDGSARRNTDYWYRVQVMTLDGTLSAPSAEVKYRY